MYFLQHSLFLCTPTSVLRHFYICCNSYNKTRTIPVFLNNFLATSACRMGVWIFFLAMSFAHQNQDGITTICTRSVVGTFLVSETNIPEAFKKVNGL